MSEHLPRISYVSGTRADFGLMRRALLAIHHSGRWAVEIAATGMHLDPAFGHTLAELKSSGLPVATEVPTALGARDPLSTIRAFADAIQGFAAAWHARRPHAVMLLGDRGEMLAGALAAAQLGIPIIHVHGGERSGTLDEPTRHAISKFATLHWVASSESKARLERMGEEAQRITITGAPGLDGLADETEQGQAAFAAWARSRWGMQLPSGLALVLMHPEGASIEQAAAQTHSLAAAVAALDMPTLWLKPNSDAGSAGILAELSASAQLEVVTHMARPEFCAAMAQASVMLGNSSSGIIEAASFGTPVLNIGQRQRLRQRNANVTDVDWDSTAILTAARSALAQGRLGSSNVYGDGQASARMLAALDAWGENPGAAPVEKFNAY